MGGGWLALSEAEARIVAALAARIFPSDELGPGAAEAGVVRYIDRALAGDYAALLPRYSAGIAAVDAYSRRRAGCGFAELEPEAQDAALAALERGEVAGCGEGGSAGFLELVIRHTREGLFCDPAHGGNRDLAGWRLLGFPGIQIWGENRPGAGRAPAPVFTPEEQLGAPIRRERLGTMADVAAGRPGE